MTFPWIGRAKVPGVRRIGGFGGFGGFGKFGGFGAYILTMTGARTAESTASPTQAGTDGTRQRTTAGQANSRLVHRHDERAGQRVAGQVEC